MADTGSGTYIPPSIYRPETFAGESYSHFSPVPPSLLPQPASASSESTATPSPAVSAGEPCCLGVDEAGRGPVLGPMVYGVFYLPLTLSDSLLKDTHHFDDSKVLQPAVRSSLMRTLCEEGSDLHTSCGWAIASLSARDIGANMLRPVAMYNLNAQAQDATVSLIQGVLDRGVNVREVYIDTIGQPHIYQAKLERIFPTLKLTVAKKADSLYPCVSAASVCAKVSRDAALEVLYEARRPAPPNGGGDVAEGAIQPAEGMAWGSGYPSDQRCVTWLKGNMHPVFGWGPECRFSWGTAKDMMDTKNGVKVEWPQDEDENASRLTDYFAGRDGDEVADELGTWFGSPAGLEAF
ncbi:ribonuclease H2 subunit A [Microdochium nivale]|nr:ribonuclease H2 subunit A [Microdochium nivale]